MAKKKLTHSDKQGRPVMVDVSSKSPSLRRARASADVQLGKEIMSLLKDDEVHTRKGPVFQTAILAGIMAAKQTPSLIPLCHSLPLEDCRIKITPTSQGVHIEAEATTTGKTGVEMEVLSAVTVAALTVYDMCKAVSHGIEIKNVRLMEKTGGKSDFKRN